MISAFIIAATTADGFIAKDGNHSPMSWTSKDDKTRFIELTKRAGVVIMGSRTFETLPHPLKDRLNIVYSRSKKFDGVEVTQEPPETLLQNLEKRGFTEAAVCGGSKTYTAFIKARAVDRIYLTVEPVLFGQGIPLFCEPLDPECRLELVSSNPTPCGTLFLEYKVVYR
jgi:dihydrofolate reductase